ncbi:MAG: hypothetical protein QOI52_305 [Chloroflexota bacterium]|nr:hypothetical protein [Chloroflexota bacterium]
MAGRFDGQVIVVTGGARGIGAEIVTRAVVEGARGVVTDVDAASRPLPGVRYITMDVTDRAAVEAAFADIEATEGRVDILVNNAGIQRVGLTETFDPATWELVVQTHLMGTFHCSAMAIRSMREHGGGAIVQVASVAALIALPGRGPYAAAKAAMMSLSRVMAVEVADLGIRVNAVAPGMALTAIVEEGIANGSIRLDTMLPEIPLRRLATVADIAAAVLFLASSDAAYITGQTLVVDGGWSILGMHDRPDWLQATPEDGGRAAT